MFVDPLSSNSKDGVTIAMLRKKISPFSHYRHDLSLLEECGGLRSLSPSSRGGEILLLISEVEAVRREALKQSSRVGLEYLRALIAGKLSTIDLAI